jgi:vitamin B12 transporter
MEWKNDFHLVPHHTFSVGFENRQEWGDDSNYSEYPDAWTGTVDSYASSFTKRTDRVNGWYLQDQASYGKRFFLSSGARWDRNDLYGGRATWRLAPAYLLPVVRTKLKTTLGTGWKTPTLYQRFSEYGNPNLLPERSLSWDAGFEQPFFGDKMRLNAVYFDNRYKNYLDFDNLAFVYLNIPRVRTRGAETSLDGHLYRDSLVQLTFNRTDAKNQDTGEKLLRRAFERSSFRLDSPTFHGTRAGFEVLYTGRRQDLVFPADWSPAYQITLPDYTLVRLHADWKPSKRITVFGRIENLFNRRYQEVLGYQTSLRAFYAGTTLDL